MNSDSGEVAIYEIDCDACKKKTIEYQLKVLSNENCEVRKNCSGILFFAKTFVWIRTQTELYVWTLLSV